MFDPSQPPATLPEMAHRSFAAHAGRPCLGSKPPGESRRKASGEYSYATYAEIGARVRHIAGGLQKLGLARGERAVILAENRPEWAIFDLACQMLGVITVPLFSTLPAVQVKDLITDCGARLVLVSSAAQRAKIEEIQNELPALEFVICLDDAPDGRAEYSTFAALEAAGAAYWEANLGGYEATWPAAAPDDVATIIYTSGTTGVPKGVMLTQRNLVSNVEAIIRAIQFTSDDVFLSFLPLAHIYERTAGFYLPIRIGGAIAYCESLFTVADNMAEVRPTIMFSVPRLYETMREKMLNLKLPEKEKTRYLAALELAQKAGATMGKMPDAPALSFVEQIKFKVYDAMLYGKIRARYGGRLRAFVSGGAPIAPELGALFLGLGLQVLEGYGLTETSPVIAVNRPGRPHLGTVGEPIGALDVRIAGDGEILVKGASVMKGYWEKPDETRAALDEDGWFHTGDLGVLADGFLKITGRKKDLLVLANGKKVAPAPIELRLTESKYIAQAVLLGDNRKAVSALIVPNLDALREYSAQQKLGLNTDDELLEAAPIRELLRREIDAAGEHLADFERVRHFTLLKEPFSVEAGEMTPTLKIKRAVVARKYGDFAGD
jgi:long-chain acyl-CoA synthetase